MSTSARVKKSTARMTRIARTTPTPCSK
jgi:hypothetical protein